MKMTKNEFQNKLYQIHGLSLMIVVKSEMITNVDAFRFAQSIKNHIILDLIKNS